LHNGSFIVFDRLGLMRRTVAGFDELKRIGFVAFAVCELWSNEWAECCFYLQRSKTLAWQYDAAMG